MDYKPGDVLKLSEEGLESFAHGKKKALERCISWRFEYLSVDPILIDKWGEKTLAVKPIDIEDDLEPPVEHWTRRYLVKIKQ